MKYLRRSAERGREKLGWLDSRHSFSFGSYHDARHMGFGPLRVINEDKVSAGQGFPTHPHRNMEILSYVVDGALTHQDSLGGGSVIHSGDVQLISAGSGVRHSEWNDSDRESTHFLQIWIEPSEVNLQPRYEQKSFREGLQRGGLILIASPNANEHSLKLMQDVDIYACKSEDAGATSYAPSRRRLWVQVIKGEVATDGEVLEAGDGLGSDHTNSTGTKEITLAWKAGSEFLVFDLP